jgi:hypothetical protein
VTPRRTIVRLAGALIAVPVCWPALAQTSDRAVLNGLRECTAINDVSARVACYDAHMAAESGKAVATVPVDEKPATVRAPSGFGSEAIQSPSRTERRPASEHQARVSAVVEHGPGIYQITLEDGAQWQFVESARPTYDPPVRGSAIEIRRGALGSFLMRYAGQASVRVIRLR